MSLDQRQPDGDQSPVKTDLDSAVQLQETKTKRDVRHSPRGKAMKKVTEKVPQETSDSPQAMTIMTNTDAYINERMKGQAASVEDVLGRKAAMRDDTSHRLELPNYFKKFSYDHPQVGGKGKLVFRWIYKHKRAIDYAMNVRNWVLVNRRHFKDAPRHLFSANGGVEEGDNILAWIPAQEALTLRNAPGKKSSEHLRAIKSKGDEEGFYHAKLSPESEEGSDTAPAGALQEGRDFNTESGG